MVQREGASMYQSTWMDAVMAERIYKDEGDAAQLNEPPEQESKPPDPKISDESATILFQAHITDMNDKKE